MLMSITQRYLYRICSETSSHSRHLFSSSMASTSASLSSEEKKRRERIQSSKLYFDIDSSKMSLIYSSAYNISFMGLEKLHPFDSSKWGRVHKYLISKDIVAQHQFVEPEEATDDDLLIVHTKTYLNSLKSSANVSIIVEVPPVALLPNAIVNWRVLRPFKKQVGGTVLAGKLAIEQGWSINIGGGFHHCSSNRGGGFCVYADISLCIQFAFAKLGISREMDMKGILLMMDFTARSYINQRVELWSGIKTDEYLKVLDKELKVAQDAFSPQMIIYNAGTDILNGDPLGRMRVDPKGVIERDERVFAFAAKNKVPIVMVTSGGYMKSSAQVIAESIINLFEKKLIGKKD